MPRKAKVSRNGYWPFVLEFRSKNKHLNQSAAEEMASQKWKVMTKAEKEVYENRAIASRNNYRTEKLTCDGIPINRLEEKKEQAYAKEDEMKKKISSTLKELHSKGKLGEEVFLIIHMNKWTYVESADCYFACEVAVAAVSLTNGVERDVFHYIVKPGQLPVGYAFKARQYSEDTHHLHDKVFDVPSNIQIVFADLVNFLEKYMRNDTIPVIYANANDIEMIENVLSSWAYELGSSKTFKVYSLQYMLYVLRNTVAGKTVWTKDTFSVDIIEKDRFSYVAGISCEFHELEDRGNYCSRSFVVRYAYYICDVCCEDLNIPLVRGIHIPAGSENVMCNEDEKKFSLTIHGNSRGGHSTTGLADEISSVDTQYGSGSVSVKTLTSEGTNISKQQTVRRNYF